MKKTNSQISQFFIALKPAETTIELKEMTELCDATSITSTITDDSVESALWCNKGGKTSIVTGRTISIAVSLDFDSEKPSHQYLMSLIKGNVSLSNAQFVQMKLYSAAGDKVDVMSGKACFKFTSIPPTGIATDLAKFDFEIHPQDTSFVWTSETVKVR